MGLKLQRELDKFWWDFVDEDEDLVFERSPEREGNSYDYGQRRVGVHSFRARSTLLDAIVWLILSYYYGV